MIIYAQEPHLAVVEFADILRRSRLAERRPVTDTSRLASMLKHADVVVTARNNDGLLIGVSRAITDYSYCMYLSDLAVAEDYQRRGIGKQLVRRTHEAAGLNTTLILLSAPNAATYYPHIGMIKHESCWTVRSDGPS